MSSEQLKPGIFVRGLDNDFNRRWRCVGTVLLVKEVEPSDRPETVLCWGDNLEGYYDNLHAEDLEVITDPAEIALLHLMFA